MYKQTSNYINTIYYCLISKAKFYFKNKLYQNIKLLHYKYNNYKKNKHLKVIKHNYYYSKSPETKCANNIKKCAFSLVAL